MERLDIISMGISAIFRCKGGDNRLLPFSPIVRTRVFRSMNVINKVRKVAILAVVTLTRGACVPANSGSSVTVLLLSTSSSYLLLRVVVVLGVVEV